MLVPIVLLGYLAYSVINWINTPSDLAPEATAVPTTISSTMVPRIAATTAAMVATATDVFAPAAAATTAPRASVATVPASDPLIQHNVSVRALDGHVAYVGDVDLRPVLARIAAGVRDPHPNDGSVFTNVERVLPVQSDQQYYREYVVRTPNISAVGPQRLIIGRAGDVWYTSDHYAHFVRVQ